MAVVNTADLITFLQSKKQWSGREELIELLQALETATPTVVPEVPNTPTAGDIATALESIGLITIAAP